MDEVAAVIRKKVILADEDEQYLREIRYAFMEIAPQIDLVTFTSRQKVYEYLEQGGKSDILVVDEQLAGEQLKNLTIPMTRIALSLSLTPIDGFQVVKKYQRMETLLNTILLKYAQDTGTLEAVRGNSHTKLAAFYSPAGGTGKTTLSLAMAAASVKAGLRTLYLNLEEIDSVNNILGRTPGRLSDVFFSLQARHATTMQVGIKIKECAGLEPTAGFDYISGVESISEYEEISSENMKLLLETIRELSNYELVVLDLSSAFTNKSRQVLEASDVVFMPVTETEGSIGKLQRFLEEANLHQKYDSIFDKTRLILNQAGAGGAMAERLLNSMKNRLSFSASVAPLPVLTRFGDILGLGDMLLPLMEPMLQLIMEERVRR